MPGRHARPRPTKGGILKYVVPAEPPSFDGHRETTFALIHPIAPFYSLLIRVDPTQPYKSGNFVCDLCTEMPKPTDGGKTYTFKHPQGRQVQRRLDAHREGRRRDLQQDHLPAEGRRQRPQGVLRDGRQRERARRLHRRVQAEISLRRLHPGAREPLQLHLFQGDPRQGYALVREERHGFRAVHVGRPRGRRLHQGQAQPELLHQGQALSRRLRGHLRQEAVAARAGHSGRPRRDRVPRLPAQEPRRPGARARQQDHRPGEQLELRADRHAEPAARSRSTTCACAAR